MDFEYLLLGHERQALLGDARRLELLGQLELGGLDCRLDLGHAHGVVDVSLNLCFGWIAEFLKTSQTLLDPSRHRYAGFDLLALLTEGGLDFLLDLLVLLVDVVIQHLELVGDLPVQLLELACHGLLPAY